MYLFGALLKTSIYYFTDTEPASSGIPAREVSTSYDQKHWPASVISLRPVRGTTVEANLNLMYPRARL